MQSGYGLYSEEHEAFRRLVRKVVDAELRPHASEWERAGEFPRALFTRFGELGFLGLKYPPAWGGTDAGVLYEAVLVEELARCGSGGVAAGLSAQFSIATGPIHLFGNDDQKRRYLAPAIRGEKVGALAVTEPGGGSDVAALVTTARRDGEHYVVNGAKTYITNGVRADFVVAAVRTGPAGGGHEGISMLVVDRGTPGFSVGRRLDKLGWRASDTAELVFEDCRVPAANLLGEENAGFLLFMGNFQWERLVLALGAVGAAEQVLEGAIQFARDRRAFGRPLTGFQVTRHRLAELATDLECARQLTYHALRLHAGGEMAIKETSMAKKVATEMACRVADGCLQLHGGAGYMMESDIQRQWRDARLGPIGGGTSEIMNEIISRQLGL